MTHAARRLLPIAFALLALAAMAPGTAAAGLSTAAFPNQSLGNRGADVRAIQGLLRAHGSTIAVDGIFGATTRDAVKAFQTSKGLSATGIVRDTTWAKLIVGLHPGATGEAVKVVQRELNEKRRAGLTVNGIFGTATRNAVIAFQRHVRMTPHGNVGAVTWRKLIWHYDYPSFSASANLCDYSVGNGKANWATGAAIGQLEAASKAFAATHQGRVSVGDASYEHGGNIPRPRDPRGRSRRRRPPDPGRGEPVHVGHELAVRVVRPGRHPDPDQDDPGGRARPRQAHLLQRPGPHPRGPHDVVQRSRRPPPHPVLRAVLPDRAVPLLSGQGRVIFSVTSLANRPGWRPPSTT